MDLNQASIELIKGFEGLELTAYKDPVGIWTIGYGHTDAAGAPRVTPGLVIAEDEAGQILRRDLGQYEAAVDSAVKVPLSKNQRGALVSLCYNIGPRAFRKSTVVRRREAERALFLTDVGETGIAEANLAAPVEGGEQKPMARSKTGWLGGLTFAGALATIRDVRESLPEAGDYLPYALAVVGLLIVLNRWNEARKGEH